MWSSWTDSQLKDFAVKNGLYPSDKKTPTRSELLPAVAEYYNGASKTAYDTWSDSRIKSWLNSHGVGKAKQATKREELMDLMARNYVRLAKISPVCPSPD